MLVIGSTISPGVCKGRAHTLVKNARLHAARLSLIRHLPSCGLDLMKAVLQSLCVLVLYAQKCTLRCNGKHLRSLSHRNILCETMGRRREMNEWTDGEIDERVNG